MKVFAYCCASFREATRKAAGVEPITCPPVESATFDLAWLGGRDLIYLDLHGEPGMPAWLGDEGRIALTDEQVRKADLGQAVVFAANCYLGDDDSPMLDALLDAGASYVIAGDGSNWGGTRSPMGASLLGLWFRRLMAFGIPVLNALSLAKDRLAFSLIKPDGRDIAQDTLAFRAFYREKEMA